MRAKVADLALHVDETLNDRELLNLEQAIRSDFGIISVGHSDVDRHWMLVVYDPDVIQGKEILSRVTKQGFHGELVGI